MFFQKRKPYIRTKIIIYGMPQMKVGIQIRPADFNRFNIWAHKIYKIDCAKIRQLLLLLVFFQHLQQYCVRSLTAIICLTAFFALQYGKLVSYWNCRFVSIYTATACDCVQQLLDAHKHAAPYTTATLKEKTEEIMLFHELVESWQFPATPVIYETAYFDAMPETYKAAVFQPPRFTQNA